MNKQQVSDVISTVVMSIFAGKDLSPGLSLQFILEEGMNKINQEEKD
jgi:hypothetical protein